MSHSFPIDLKVIRCLCQRECETSRHFKGMLFARCVVRAVISKTGGTSDTAAVTVQLRCDPASTANRVQNASKFNQLAHALLLNEANEMMLPTAPITCQAAISASHALSGRLLTFRQPKLAPARPYAKSRRSMAT
jgi:hypothetical protein